jgi:cysteine-rich repeat protein
MLLGSRVGTVLLLLVAAAASPAFGWQWDDEWQQDSEYLDESCSHAAAPPVIDGDTLFVPYLYSPYCPDQYDGGLRIQALDTHTGMPRWRWSLFPTPGGCTAGHILGTTDGDLLVGASAWACEVPVSFGGYLVRIDGATGVERWRRNLSALLLLADGDLIATTDGRIARLDGTTGDERWSHPIDDSHATFATIRSTGDVLIALYEEITGVHTLLTLDTTDGTGRARSDVNAEVVLQAGGLLLTRTYSYDDGAYVLIALDADTLLERWRYLFTTWNADGPPAPVAGAHGILLVPGTPAFADFYQADMGVLALDVVTGLERWRWSLDGGLDQWERVRHVVALPDGDVLVAGGLARRVLGRTFLVARLAGDDGTVHWLSDAAQPAAPWPAHSDARFLALAPDDTIVVSAEYEPTGHPFPIAAALTLSLATGSRAPCGDGVVDVGETCDDGNAIDGDGCDRSCTPTGCGNGVIDPTEVCEPSDPTWGASCRADCTSDLTCPAIDLRGAWTLRGGCSSSSIATSVRVSWSHEHVDIAQDCATGAVTIASAGATVVTIDVTSGVGAGAPTRRFEGTVGSNGEVLSGFVVGNSLEIPSGAGVVTLDAPIAALGCPSSHIALTRVWSGTIDEDRLGHGAIVAGPLDLGLQPLDANDEPCGFAAALECAFVLERGEPTTPVEPPDPPVTPSPPAHGPEPDETCVGLRAIPAAACVLAAAWRPAECTSDSIPAGVRRSMRRARRLLARDVDHLPAASRIARVLRRAAIRTERATARGALSSGCATALAHAFRRARDVVGATPASPARPARAGRRSAATARGAVRSPRSARARASPPHARRGSRRRATPRRLGPSVPVHRPPPPSPRPAPRRSRARDRVATAVCRA